jgi:hypothetical protein
MTAAPGRRPAVSSRRTRATTRRAAAATRRPGTTRTARKRERDSNFLPNQHFERLGGKDLLFSFFLTREAIFYIVLLTCTYFARWRSLDRSQMLLREPCQFYTVLTWSVQE